jgi:hypothetical protein
MEKKRVRMKRRRAEPDRHMMESVGFRNGQEKNKSSRKPHKKTEQKTELKKSGPGKSAGNQRGEAETA